LSLKRYEPEKLFNYTPAIKPFPSLTIENVCSKPLACPVFSEEFIPYLIGLLDIYQFTDKFLGTDEERQHSVDLFTDLRTILMSSQNCCCGSESLTIVIEHRITIDGRVEISIDGGSTWSSDPNDISHNIPAYPPPVTAGVSATKCDAATNGHQHALDMIAEISAGFDSTDTLLDFIKLVADIIVDLLLIYFGAGAGIGVIDTLIEVLFGAVKDVYAAHKTAWDTYWTSDETDKILCALYCNISDDGTFTDSSYAAVISKLQSDLTPSAQKDLFIQTYKAVGLAGLNKYCSYGSAADSDCSDCSCGVCDLDQWTTYFGTENSRTDSAINVTAVIDGSRYDVGFKTGGDSQCCSYVSIAFDGESPSIVHFYWIACGSSQSGDWTAADSAFAPDISVAVNQLLISCNAPWSGVVTFG